MKTGRRLSGLAVGSLFGVGLAVSQMTNPEKVLAFLNVADSWDPSLLFVMGAASVVAFVGFRIVLGGEPVFDREFHLPTSTAINGPLVAGAALFGLGWGLAGYCPGPAITGLGSGSLEPWLFLPAMLAGNEVARRMTAG